MKSVKNLLLLYQNSSDFIKFEFEYTSFQFLLRYSSFAFSFLNK